MKEENMNRYEEALNYLNYCAKNGYEVDYDGLSKSETIKLANQLESQADAAYEAWKERDIE